MSERWSAAYGERPYRVVAEERHDRHGHVYLRWREAGNWRRRNTRVTVRTKGGELVQARVAKVESLAKEVMRRLAAGHGIDPDAEKPLTIRDGLALVTDPRRGKYPKDTPHRREVERELERAAVILENRPWDAIEAGDLRALYRVRAEVLRSQGKVGRRGAEVTVARVLAVAEWLREERKIPIGACRPPKNWKQELGAEVTEEPPHRPRHTIEEYRRILAVAPKVDPRFGLLARLGVGLRLGQVRRVRRRQVDLAARRMRVPGKGKKGGALVALIDEDVAMLEAAFAGYLAPLEAQYQAGMLADYHLFPSGRLAGSGRDSAAGVCHPEQGAATSIVSTTVRNWWRRAERLAGVPHVTGRATYGGKRVAIDEAKAMEVSRDTLASLGGWADTQMADRVYADQEAEAAAVSAARARAKIRGLDTPQAYPRRTDETAPEGDTSGGQS